MNPTIATLPTVTLDYAHRGPGLHPGLTQLEGLLAAGRAGHLVVNVAVAGAVIPAVMARSDLYILGFRCGSQWFRFDDAAWPFADAATPLGFRGNYGSLGGLTGSLTAGSIAGVARLASTAHRPRWADALRTLLIVVSECARLVPVRMHVLGVLNDVVETVPLAPLAHYIQNWGAASAGRDMSRPNGPNGRVGFRDPAIIRR